MGSLLSIAIIAFSFACTSLVEEAEDINEKQNFYASLIYQLENMEWETNSPNARSNNSMPSFLVTIRALQSFDLILPAVKDRATVLIATDEAYAKLGIFPGNVSDRPDLIGIIGNQVIPARTIKASALPGNTFENVIGLPLTFSNHDSKIIVTDNFGNQANIIRTDWKALNSTTHFIDHVLAPH